MNFKNEVLSTQFIIENNLKELTCDTNLIHQSILLKLNRETQNTLSDLDYSKKFFKINNIKINQVYNSSNLIMIIINGVNPMLNLMIVKYITHLSNVDFILKLIADHEINQFNNLIKTNKEE